jgi:hypothetical protein
MMRSGLLFKAIGFLSLAIFCACPAKAGVLTFNFSGFDFSGPDPNPNGGPYNGSGGMIPQVFAQLTLDDMASGLDVNEVRGTLKFLTTGLSIDKIASVYFNFDPGLSASDLVINDYDSTALGSYSFADDSMRVDGAGLFDLSLSFGGGNALSPGETFDFDLQLSGASSGTLTSDSFRFKSVDGNTSPPDSLTSPKSYYAALHLLETGIPNESGHYAGSLISDVPPPGTVPEPASLAVWSLMVAGGGFGAMRRRRKTKA